MFWRRKKLIAFKSRRQVLIDRRAELYVELWGLNFEMASWNKLLARPVKANWTARGPQEVAKLIGRTEAEINLIDYELLATG